jgi:hypothetical protein
MGSGGSTWDRNSGDKQYLEELIGAAMRRFAAEQSARDE